MGIKEQVKQGKLSIAEALNKVAPETKTYAWLERRSQKARISNAAKEGRRK